MNLVRFIAGRYLFSKKNTNAINIISGISVLIFTVGAAVMIIILSFLNGLEGLVKQMNNSFDPDLKITARYSKSFQPDSVLSVLNQLDEVELVSQTVEDNVVVRYGEAQEIARVKGVDQHFREVTSMDTFIVYGRYALEHKGKNLAIFGSAISASLNINVENDQTQAALFVPKKGVQYNSLNPEASLNTSYAMPSGIVLLNEDGDKDLIISSLEMVRELFELEKEVTALEVKVASGEIEEVREAVLAQFNDAYEVRDRSEQNEAAYKVFKTEKWATFAILTLVVLIAAFNTIGALTMLVLEKKKDISILKSMGAERGLVQRIFLSEGMFITWVGLILGLVLGIGFVLMQKHYGIIPLQGSFVDYFPVALKWTDVISVSLTISLLGLLASVYPSLKAADTK
ncbi:MAG: FtsX-like permease family protein [Bacteroidia bacterium]|nr:FtsX-like permease family protein [Bacteroidia bacterium]